MFLRLGMSVYNFWGHPSGGVVWYLFALIYSCIIINFIYKKKACIIKFLPLLIIGYYCLIPYSISLIPEYGWRSALVTNNFLFEGIPFITLGWSIRSLTKWNVSWKTWMFLRWYLLLQQCLRLVWQIGSYTHGFSYFFHYTPNCLHNDGSLDISTR